jgi:serine/threonine protein kinase
MKLIALDPKERITARQALKHPYFDDFDKNSM